MPFGKIVERGGLAGPLSRKKEKKKESQSKMSKENFPTTHSRQTLKEGQPVLGTTQWQALLPTPDQALH